MAGAGAFSALSVPQYQASTQLYVSVRSTGVDGALSDLTQGGTYARQAVLSYVDVVTSASVLGAVIEDLGLDLQIPELRDMVSSSSPTNSVLIDIRVTGPDPDQAAAIANSAGGNFAEVVTTVLERPTDGGASPVQISAIEEATSPPTPVSPNTTRNLALGFVLGLVVAPRYLGEGWFEKQIFTWGWATGSVATGIALLRIVDPDSESGTLEEFGYAYIPLIPIEGGAAAIAPLMIVAGLSWAVVGVWGALAILGLWFLIATAKQTVSRS